MNAYGLLSINNTSAKISKLELTFQYDLTYEVRIVASDKFTDLIKGLPIDTLSFDMIILFNTTAIEINKAFIISLSESYIIIRTKDIKAYDLHDI